ncbi:MAG: helix-turn-helix domain-containing protein, partial [Lutispora sp.]
IRKAMEKYKNKSKVAETLNISRAALYRKMEKYNIK